LLNAVVKGDAKAAADMAIAHLDRLHRPLLQAVASSQRSALSGRDIAVASAREVVT
jgi:hypothetical protein